LSQPTLTGLLEIVRSPEVRPLIREALWAAGIALGLIVLAAIIVPGIAYAIYLAVAIFFASTLTGLFVSLLEAQTGERVFASAHLRRWLGGCAALLALLAAIILV
jgi:hypothetical protein